MIILTRSALALVRVMEKVSESTTVDLVDSPIKLLLVDDEVQVRRGLAMAFSTEPDLQVIGEAENGCEAIELAETLHPDVVLMDLRMSRLDGLRATERIRQAAPDVRVVVLSLQDDLLTRRAAADAGARAFVGKGEGSEKLVSTIRRIAAAS